MCLNSAQPPQSDPRAELQLCSPDCPCYESDLALYANRLFKAQPYWKDCFCFFIDLIVTGEESNRQWGERGAWWESNP